MSPNFHFPFWHNFITINSYLFLLDEWLFYEHGFHPGQIQLDFGNTHTLTDVAWAPSITALKIDDFDFTPFPNVEAWHRRVTARLQFEKAFLKWIREASWGN